MSEFQKFYHQHEQQLKDIIEKEDPSMTLGRKIALLESIPDAKRQFDEVDRLLLDSDYWDHLLQTIHLTRDNYWALETGFEPFLDCAIHYLTYQLERLRSSEDAIAYFVPITTTPVFRVKHKEWTRSCSLSQDWPSDLSNETFLGCHDLPLYYDDPMQREESELKYRTLVQQVLKTNNSSALFYLYNGYFTEPVLVFNHEGQTTMLLSGAYIHRQTQALIHELHIPSQPCRELKVVHNGDCSMYGLVNLNLIAHLSKREHSVLKVLIQLRESRLDLSAYFIPFSMIHPRDVKGWGSLASEMTIARLLSHAVGFLRSIGLEQGLVGYLKAHGMDDENGLFLHAPRPKIESELSRYTRIQESAPRRFDAQTPDVFPNPPDRHQSISLEKADFMAQLNRLNGKIRQLAYRQKIARQHDSALKEAHQAASTLYKALLKEARYFNDPHPTDEKKERFKRHCQDAIQQAHSVLDQHRGWSEFLVNLLLVIVSGGLLLLGKGFYNRSMHRPFFFVHQTDSSKILDAISDQLLHP